MPSLSHPTFKQIARTDMLSLLALLAPAVFLVLAVLAARGLLPDRSRSLLEGELRFLDPKAAAVFVAMSLGGLALGWVVLQWRLGKIRRAFGSGLRVPGRITKLTLFKDRAYVHYAYEVGSVQATTRHFVHQTEEVKGLTSGQAVTVAVDARAPRDGFLVELFPERSTLVR